MDSNLLYFILGTIATILIELTVMPRLKEWQYGRTNISRQKRQKELRADLAYIADLYEDRNKLIATAVTNLVIIITMYAFSLVMLITSVILLILDNQSSVLYYLGDGFTYTRIFVYISNGLIVFGITFFIVGVNLSFKIIGILNRIKQYETFKQQTEARIQELSQGK